MPQPPDIDTLLPPIASDVLHAMARAAATAAIELQTAFGARHSLQIDEKSKGDFVSQADKNAEAQIAEALETTFPTYGWLGEETGFRLGTADGLHWITDPLDGTINFLKGIPHWAISIALCQGEDVRAGLIYDPCKNELFCAMRNKGAYLNGARIHVSREPLQSAALFATGVPAGGRITYLEIALQDVQRLMPHCAGIRRGGAAALDLAYVACGRLEGYWERNLGPWDIAAGALLVQEAGGAVSRLWPDQSVLTSGSFIASAPQFSETLRACVSDQRISSKP